MTDTQVTPTNELDLVGDAIETTPEALEAALKAGANKADDYDTFPAYADATGDCVVVVWDDVKLPNVVEAITKTTSAIQTLPGGGRLTIAVAYATAKSPAPITISSTIDNYLPQLAMTVAPVIHPMIHQIMSVTKTSPTIMVYITVTRLDD